MPEQALLERSHAAVIALMIVAEEMEETVMALTIESSAFPSNGAIPRKYTCEGADLSPPLAWSGEPGRTMSFALVVDDQAIRCGNGDISLHRSSRGCKVSAVIRSACFS